MDEMRKEWRKFPSCFWFL